MTDKINLAEHARHNADELKRLAKVQHELAGRVTSDTSGNQGFACVEDYQLARETSFLTFINLAELCAAFVVDPTIKPIALDGLAGNVQLNGDLTPEVARAIAINAHGRAHAILNATGISNDAIASDTSDGETPSFVLHRRGGACDGE